MEVLKACLTGSLAFAFALLVMAGCAWAEVDTAGAGVLEVPVVALFPPNRLGPPELLGAAPNKGLAGPPVVAPVPDDPSEIDLG